MDPVAALKSCHLFRGFTPTGLQIIAAACGARQFVAGMPLFAENMAADGMFVLADGSVALTAKGPQGDEVPVGELGPGDYLGELALIQPGRRMCTATATSTVTALELKYGDFQKLMAEKPQACIKLLMAIIAGFGERLQGSREVLRSLLTKQ